MIPLQTVVYITKLILQGWSFTRLTAELHHFRILSVFKSCIYSVDLSEFCNVF